MNSNYSIATVVAALLMLMLGTSSCHDRKPAPTDSVAPEPTTDTTSSDTLSKVLEEQPMPKAADELFDDFFFNFAGNRKLQRHRIVFPCPFTATVSSRAI